MRTCDVDPRDDADFDRWYAVVEAAQRHERPDEPDWSRQELHALALASLPGGDGSEVTRHVVAEQDGEVVGAARIDLPQRDNLHLAYVEQLVVHPQHRRRGLGTALLAQVDRLAAQAGRRELIADVREPPETVGRSPGRAFCLAEGFTLAQTEVRRDLDVPVPEDRLAALEEGCWSEAQGYVLTTWRDACPDELLEQRALLSRRMSTDAPLGDLPLTEEEWDAGRVRSHEQLAQAQGRTLLTAAAVHEATGALVAYTEVAVPSEAPERAYQWDTLVLREHRGHRLGTLVKLANLRQLARVSPRTRTVSTWNAQENAAMIAVNEALGCRTAGGLAVWRRPVGGTA